MEDDIKVKSAKTNKNINIILKIKLSISECAGLWVGEWRANKLKEKLPF